MPMSSSLVPVNVTLFKKRVFADVIKLRDSRWDHPRLHRWALNPMTGILTERQKRRRPGEDRRRDSSYAAKSQGTLESSES